MSHVAWSVLCLCVGHTGELSKNGWIEIPFRGWLSGSKEWCIRVGSRCPAGRGTLGGMCRCMSTLRTVGLPLRANVPAQRTRRMNAFAAARGDNTAMRPFAKLLWTVLIYFCTLHLLPCCCYCYYFYFYFYYYYCCCCCYYYYYYDYIFGQRVSSKGSVFPPQINLPLTLIGD